MRDERAVGLAHATLGRILERDGELRARGQLFDLWLDRAATEALRELRRHARVANLVLAARVLRRDELVGRVEIEELSREALERIDARRFEMRGLREEAAHRIRAVFTRANLVRSKAFGTATDRAAARALLENDLCLLRHDAVG